MHYRTYGSMIFIWVLSGTYMALGVAGAGYLWLMLRTWSRAAVRVVVCVLCPVPPSIHAIAIYRLVYALVGAPRSVHVA